MTVLRDYGHCTDPATRECFGRAMPGARALRDAVDDLFEELGDLGIYNCRNTASGGPSTHRHGRAWDCGCNTNNADQKAVGDFLVALLVDNYKAFGVQRIIFFHRIWDPTQGWHAYGCDRPGSPLNHHTDHAHIELCWDAARDHPLTVTYVKEAMMQIVEDALRKVLKEEGLLAMDPAGKLTIAQMLTESEGGALVDGIKLIRKELKALSDRIPTT